MSNPSALLLLADHIKLSLLEQRRARTLELSRDSQDGHISRSLDQLQQGIEALEKERQHLQEAGHVAKATTLGDTLASLHKQYSDLSSQFHGSPSAATASTLTSPNDPSLAADFAHAQSSTSHSHSQPQPQPEPSSSSSSPPGKEIPSRTTSTAPRPKKAVRFSSPTTDLEAQSSSSSSSSRTNTNTNTNSLFPYHDDDDSSSSAGYRDRVAADGLSNTQIHDYHRQILDEQDAQLDALGASIARQRELSMHIGDELDSQVVLLDESERAADRQLGSLGRARRQVGRIARGAARSGEGRQMGAIVVLIVVLVLLIVTLK